MRKIGTVAAVLLAGLLAYASEVAMAADLSVNFKFTAAYKCSKVSPEIHVGNIPSGTAAFKVRLRDLDVPTWRHGGGTVPADPSGVIARGALKDGYNGPCPPSGSHNYEFTVKAVDANGETLAEGSSTQRFP